ncbi:MAG: hypothetical protein ACM3PT_05125 [Deltaproteobacteria bacterium]
MKEEIKRELQDFGSVLTENERKLRYTADSGYFRKMQDNVIARVGIKRPAPLIMRFIKSNVSGIAASVLLILGIYFLVFRNNTESNAIAHEDAYDYLNHNLDNIDADLFIEYIDESLLVNEDESFPDDKTIETYLKENPENLDKIDIEQLF